jgi:hypothetical protein
MDEQAHLPIEPHSPGPNYPVHENNQPPAVERVVKTRQPRINLKGGVTAKRREAMRAYKQTEKGKAAQDREVADRRYHTALRKAVKLAEAELKDARILGKPDVALAELEGRAKVARADLDAYEQDKEARKAARRVDSAEKKQLQHERQKAFKRVYARKKAAEKRAERLNDSESSRARDEDDGDGDDGQGSEMDDDEVVALADEMEEDDGPVMGTKNGD